MYGLQSTHEKIKPPKAQIVQLFVYMDHVQTRVITMRQRVGSNPPSQPSEIGAKLRKPIHCLNSLKGARDPEKRIDEAERHKNTNTNEYLDLPAIILQNLQ